MKDEHTAAFKAQLKQYAPRPFREGLTDWSWATLTTDRWAYTYKAGDTYVSLMKFCGGHKNTKYTPLNSPFPLLP